MFRFEWFEPKEWERFIPWLKRECCHCLYPLSEHVRYTTASNGKRKKEYCCDICYVLRERRYKKTND